jgi:AcrR family transcriptional regulator
VPATSAARGRSPSARQRSKSEKTRDRVLDATLELIAQDGFRCATSQRIASASGMSWGAIQYQFGSKTSIFEALLDRILSEFSIGLRGQEDPVAPRTLPSPPSPRSSRADRIHRIVDGAMRLFEQPLYRAFREMIQDPVLLEELGMTPVELTDRIHRAVNPWILETLDLPELDRKQTDLFQATLFATTSGISEQSRYEGFPRWMTEEQLRILEKNLLRMVTRKNPPR